MRWNEFSRWRGFFRSYLTKTQEFVTLENKEAARWIEKLHVEDTPNQEYEFYSEKEFRESWKDAMEESISEELTEHTEIIFRSFLLILFANFEESLNHLCDGYQRYLNLKLGLKDIKGTGIQRSTAYLEKVADFKLPGKSLWDSVLDIQKVRNCIVHSAGETDDKHLMAYIQNNNIAGFSLQYEHETQGLITKHIRIRTTYDYCERALQQMEDYSNELYELNHNKKTDL